MFNKSNSDSKKQEIDFTDETTTSVNFGKLTDEEYREVLSYFKRIVIGNFSLYSTPITRLSIRERFDALRYFIDVIKECPFLTDSSKLEFINYTKSELSINSGCVSDDGEEKRIE